MLGSLAFEVPHNTRACGFCVEAVDKAVSWWRVPFPVHHSKLTDRCDSVLACTLNTVVR